VTFYRSLTDVPGYSDYGMKGRTYRYFNGKVQYPFGFGLSYTSFDYSWQQQPANINSLKDTLSFSVQIRNKGAMDGDEVMQAYFQYPNLDRMPLKELKAFKRVFVAKGTTQVIQLKIPVQELQKWDLKESQWKLYPGNYTLLIGSSSQDIRLKSTLTVKAGIK
ncbi:MAG: fibronectin type III-like domain-contianing protein, partial [Flavisolibacter sp.]